MIRRWNKKYLNLTDPDIQEYVTLKLESSSTILRVYDEYAKEDMDESSY